MKSTGFLLAVAVLLVSLTLILMSTTREQGVVLLVSLAGFGLLFFGLTHLRKAKASWDWDRVPGQILASSIEKVFDRMEDEEVSKVKILYSYSMNGRIYKSAQFRLQRSDANVRSFPEARAFSEKFAAGSTVEVYVNPLDPADSVLDPGMSERARSHQLGMVASGIVVIACSAAIEWFLLFGT